MHKLGLVLISPKAIRYFTGQRKSITLLSGIDTDNRNSHFLKQTEESSLAISYLEKIVQI